MRTTKLLPAVAALAAVALSAVPGAASAASRGFVIHNKSSQTFVLRNITSVPCNRFDSICRNDPDEQYPFDFEGYPEQYDKLTPGKSHRIELKYGPSLGKNVSYAAKVVYDRFDVQITTSTTSNDSYCWFPRSGPEARFDCKAEGLNITITDEDGWGD